jgi:hypothetical protein
MLYLLANFHLLFATGGSFMAYSVRFNFLDSMGRIKGRSFHNTNALIADVITQVGVLAPLADAIIEGGLNNVIITQKNDDDAFAATAGSDIDNGMTLTLETTAPSNYGMRIPMPIDALKLSGGVVDTANAALLLFLAEFDAAKTWRVNLDNPVPFVSIVKGTVDK